MAQTDIKQECSRIEILEWREVGDDEDELTIAVFGAGDSTYAHEVLMAESDTPRTFEFDDPDDVEGPCFITNTRAICDGEIMTSHDGRKFAISITEIKEKA